MATRPHTPVTRRHTIEPLDPARCWELLTTIDAARVVHVVDDEPQIAVVNIGVDEEAVVVRCTAGSRLATALSRPGSPVLVEADELDPSSRAGWSVVARGRMSPVLNQIEVARLDRTMPPSWLLGDSGGTWLRLEVDEISGRRIVPAAGDA